MTEAPLRKIAIVEDDSAVLDSLRMLLEVMGYPAATFSSAADFLRADMRDVECLVLDHHMPGMTGLELAARLRAEGAVVRILLITRLPAPATFARVAELDIEVLEKPFGDEKRLDFIGASRS
jgi:two-component system response regulator FixJ